MDDLETLRHSETISIDDELYGLSLKELETRILLFEAEILRLKRELEKKTQERSEADQLFSSKK